MSFLRSLTFHVLFWIWSTFCSLGMTPLMVTPRRGAVVAMRIWARGIVVLLRICQVRVELRGTPPTGPALVASKHQCAFDVFAEFIYLYDCCFVAKQELKWIPGFGWWAWKVGMIFIDRAGHSTALKKLVRDANARLKEERQLIIFPEGTRTDPGAAPDYKPGIAALYRELGWPVHPVATNSGVHWPRKGFLLKPGTIVFEYLEPVPPGLKRAEFMRTLEERIETATTKLLAV